EIRLIGPLSVFPRTQKYGIQMAIFLPALLLYLTWLMMAMMTTRDGTAFFELASDQHKLRSHYLIEDIPVENPLLEKLAAGWDAQESEWELRPSHEVLDLGEAAFVPDLVFI